MQLTVRSACPDDVAAIADIHVAGYEEAYRGLVPDEVIEVRTPELRRRVWSERLAEHRPRELVLVADVAGKPAGFVSARPAAPAESGTGDPSIACWENLYLRPSFLGTATGLRVGLALHDAIMRGLRAGGFAESLAFVIDGNDRALRFFEALGWRRDGATREVEGMLQRRLRRSVDGAPHLARTRAHVEREYGDEKWPAVERRIEEELRAEPDAGLARVLGRVARTQWRRDDPLSRSRFVAAGRDVELPLAGAYGAGQGIVLELVTAACTPHTDLIVELGAGWGWHILSLWANGGPRRVMYVAAEYTEAGRRAAARLAALEPALRFQAVAFDYHEPRLDGLGPANHAVVFTAHSVEQIPYVQPALFEAIRSVARRVSCLHFEPVGWQVEGHAGSGSTAAYAKRHDYNRNLVSAVRAESDGGRIVAGAVVPDVFGINADNATTLITWQAEAS